MRTLVFLEAGRLEWREAPDAALETADDAVVRPLAVAACDLDVALLRGLTPFQGPFPIGHEFVGEVVAVGSAVTGFAPGDRVIVPFQIGCGACACCRSGRTGSCETVPPVSMYGFEPLGGGWGGALSDLVRVPYATAMLVPLPAGLEPATVASISDNVADGWRAVGPPLAEYPGARVLVLGGIGSVPLYAVACALAAGAAQVDYVDANADRAAVAEALGARVTRRPPTTRETYPITVDGSNDPRGLRRALQSLEPEGICTSVSIYFGGDVPLPLLAMYTRGVRFVTGRVNSRAALPRVLELVAHAGLRPERVTSEIVPWDRAAEALARPSLKPIVVRDA